MWNYLLSLLMHNKNTIGKTNSINNINLDKTAIQRSYFSSPVWKWAWLIFFPYISTWLASISTTFIRALSGFCSSPPPLGYHTNFYGLLPYFYIFLIVVWSVLSYVIINIALKHYDSVYIAPLFKIGGMLHNLLSGGVHINEFGDYSNDHKKFIVFLTGILICIIGISLLIFGYRKSNKK